MLFIKKWICKRKGHNFQHTHKESDGWGNEWSWKVCDRCDYSTFDVIPYDGKYGALHLVGKQK